MQENGDQTRQWQPNVVAFSSFAGSGNDPRNISWSSLPSFFFLFIDFLRLSSFGFCAVAGKDLEGEKDVESNGEWKERVEKWKARQEKRGLVSKEDGPGDDHDAEDDILWVILTVRFLNFQ